MDVLKNVNLALRFLLELGALVAVGYWGWKTGDGAMRWVLMVGGVAGVIVVWALFVSPNPTIELAMPLRLVIELVVWAAAAAALWAAGQTRLAVIFFVVAVISGVANYVWR
jgi:hypothetical protein